MQHTPALPTQRDLYYRAVRNAGAVNEDFLWLVQHGLTREDLQTNIERRPSLWGRFSNWVDKLPSREMPALAAA